MIRSLHHAQFSVSAYIVWILIDRTSENIKAYKLRWIVKYSSRVAVAELFKISNHVEVNLFLT